MLYRFGAIFALSLWLCALSHPQPQSEPEDRFVADRSGDSFSATFPGRHIGHANSISGVVQAQQGQPVVEAFIQLHDLRTGQMIASAYTDRVGTFEIRNVPDGTYILVATEGINQWREQITVEGMDATVSLRLPQASPSGFTSQYSVSVAQMKVPDKARRAYQKAESAVRKQKPEEAQKYLVEALAAYPDYADALTLRAIL